MGRGERHDTHVVRLARGEKRRRFPGFLRRKSRRPLFLYRTRRTKLRVIDGRRRHALHTPSRTPSPLHLRTLPPSLSLFLFHYVRVSRVHTARREHEGTVKKEKNSLRRITRRLPEPRRGSRGPRSSSRSFFLYLSSPEDVEIPSLLRRFFLLPVRDSFSHRKSLHRRLRAGLYASYVIVERPP